MILADSMCLAGMKKAGLWDTFWPGATQEMLLNGIPYGTPEL